ncbi:sulfotransferase [Arthrobacter sp. NEB 688]|uniref:sulfotransferase family protein n=1 Tax=Arthrobacter sp. NEB 688 TaxID=904039 RepID=UPI001565ED51|nr:sulfotransferase [Arthrobacter sp. NEB 688]QKE85803.1 sulfotransferase [Arthrobacter sp. NEB 688]
MSDPRSTTPSVDPSRLVFVGGLHRSGTTPFARILGEHPEVSGLEGTGVIEDEGQHLQDVYPPGTTYGGSGHFARDPRAHLTEASELATPANAERLLAAWTPYWDLGRDRLVEKSPPNMTKSRLLQALFPGARFVMVVRHPVTVALSTRKWTHFVSRDPRKFASLADLVGHWLVAHRILREDLPHLEHVHVVRYEELVRDPGATFEAVRSFLGLTGPIPTDTVRGAASDVYERAWESYRRPVRPGGLQRSLITRRFGAEIAEYGYDLDDLMAYDPRPGTHLA